MFFWTADTASLLGFLASTPIYCHHVYAMVWGRLLLSTYSEPYKEYTFSWPSHSLSKEYTKHLDCTACQKYKIDYYNSSRVDVSNDGPILMALVLEWKIYKLQAKIHESVAANEAFYFML